MSLSLEILRSSGLLSSWSRIAELSKACSCSGSYSSALSKYASAWAGLLSSRKTTPSWKKVFVWWFIVARIGLFIQRGKFRTFEVQKVQRVASKFNSTWAFVPFELKVRSDSKAIRKSISSVKKPRKFNFIIAKLFWEWKSERNHL